MQAAVYERKQREGQAAEEPRQPVPLAHKRKAGSCSSAAGEDTTMAKIRRLFKQVFSIAVAESPTLACRRSPPLLVADPRRRGAALAGNAVPTI